MTRRVSVLLTEQEYTQVKQRAGLVPLTRWFKSLVFGEEQSAGDALEIAAKGEYTSPKERDKAVSAEVAKPAGRDSPVRVGRSSKAHCKHGQIVGEYCGFCFGPAKGEK